MREQKSTKRRTQMTIDIERVLIIKSRQSEMKGWCAQCGTEVRLVVPELAAALTGLSCRAIYRLVERGDVHFTESPETRVSICLESLTSMKPSGTDSLLPIRIRRLIMKSQKTFSMLVLSGLLIICASVSHAQERGAAELKKRIFAQAMSAMGGPPAADNTAGLEVQSAAGTQATVVISGADKKRSLLGTWNVTLIFGDGSQGKSTLQVFPGRSETEGSVIHASEFSFTPPNPTLPEQGVWEYAGGSQFIASYRGYSYTEDLQPFGLIGFRHAITLSGDQESFTGRAVFEVIDSRIILTPCSCSLWQSSPARATHLPHS